MCRYLLYININSLRYVGVFCFVWRLDVGSFGIMGVGLGFVVVVGIWCKDYVFGKRVIFI